MEMGAFQAEAEATQSQLCRHISPSGCQQTSMGFVLCSGLVSAGDTAE